VAEGIFYYIVSGKEGVIMHTIKAIYDGDNFKLGEPVPVKGMYEVIITFMNPMETTQEKPKAYSWLSGNSGIDNPVKVGRDFKRYSREELYDRKNIY
jgi:hypothetical protein